MLDLMISEGLTNSIDHEMNLNRPRTGNLSDYVEFERKYLTGYIAWALFVPPLYCFETLSVGN
jgi:hypothetical protein